MALCVCEGMPRPLSLSLPLSLGRTNLTHDYRKDDDKLFYLYEHQILCTRVLLLLLLLLHSHKLCVGFNLVGGNNCKLMFNMNYYFSLHPHRY